MVTERAKSEAIIALNRLGLGARPGELARIASDPHGWAQAQITNNVVSAQIDSPSMRDVILEFRAIRKKDKPEDKKEARKAMRREAKTLMSRHLVAVAGTEMPFRERLVWFWLNHFTVSMTKPALVLAVGAYRRDAIEPHLTGRFEDMLSAVVHHPAMLVYLDNHQSIGPNSKVGRRRKRGLNENLAREILELHTLGVDGGYTQNDVIEFAKILTGWSLDPRNENGNGFGFFNRRHEPGPKQLLGKRYQSRTGEAEGQSALKDLAAHPSTAHHIATKLAVHFIADDPPSTSVKRLEDSFNRSGGDLKVLYETLLTDPELWRAEQRKFRAPFDYVMATVRAMGNFGGAMETDRLGKRIAQSLELMGQPLFRAPSPKGWPDVASHWAGSEAILERADWAWTLARRSPNRDASSLLDDVLGPQVSERTRFVVVGAADPAQGLALLFSSPEFQRR